jgi:hypothetical protein
MRAVLGASRHDPAVIWISGALGLLTLGVLSGHGTKLLAPLLLVVTIAVLSRHAVIGWDRVIALILLVVLFVPIGRYTLPGSLPFDLELYRIVVALCLLMWGASLLVDPRVRLVRTAFDTPLWVILGCVLASEITNPGRVSAYGSHVIKTLTFLLSFVLVYYLTAMTIRRRDRVDFLLKLLAVSAAVIGVLAMVEQRWRYNAFDHLHTVLPFLTYGGPQAYLKIGGNLRVFGPSQQPIALGAALVLIVPLAVYFARTSGRRRWWLVALLILVGAMASGSRTAVVMLVAEALVFLWLKPKETKKLWPAIFPALVAVHFALPGTLGGFKASFFPKGGIVAQQSKHEADYNPLLAGGRVREIKPMLEEASRKPLFGEGYGTRITGFDSLDRNAPILDNQWLNNVLDVGFIGLGAWVWLIVRAARRLAGASRTAGHPGDDWLFSALAASVTGFGVGMLTYDAFSFTQVTFIFWIILGLAAAMLRISRLRQTTRVPAPVYVRHPAYIHGRPAS